MFLYNSEYVLSTLIGKQSCYTIAGDFNLNLLDKTCKNAASFKNILKSFNLAPLFLDKPSRIQKELKTLIDNCFPNIPCNNTETWDPRHSDHIA